ncbi:MAG: hypothetical protein IPJ34_09480 [Myxococcales bacterium]|nr:hypothetical protein [Myxococcales bacterium]
MLPNALRLIQVGLASLIVAAAFRAPKRGFVFDFGGRVFHAGPYWLLAIAVLVVSYLRHEQVARFVARIPRVVLDVLFFTAAFLLVKRFTFGAFGAFPQIQDEISYDLLARRISIGQPIPASHPLFEFFRMRFLVEDGRSYPLFQPGWPLLLAVFWKLHAPGLAPAFATAMLVVAGSRLADRLYGRVASVLAGLLLLASGFLHVVGGAYFAHARGRAAVLRPRGPALRAGRPGPASRPPRRAARRHRERLARDHAPAHGAHAVLRDRRRCPRVRRAVPRARAGRASLRALPQAQRAAASAKAAPRVRVPRRARPADPGRVERPHHGARPRAPPGPLLRADRGQPRLPPPRLR